MFECDGAVRYEMKKTGRRPKVTSEIASRVKELLTSTTTATLGTTQQALEREDVFLGRTTIPRIARSERLSSQKIKLRPEIVFTERISRLRFGYAERVDPLSDDELWFLDETGFNMHVSPLRCWSEVGNTPVQPVQPSKQANLSVLMRITSDGIKHFTMKDGAYRAEDFVEFVQELAEQFPQLQHGEACLIMDNARIHHARQATQYLADNNIKHIYLPPYSPDLNPIENVFGVLKKRYRSLGVPTTRPQMLTQIRTAIEQFNHDMDLMPYYRRMRGFVHKALIGESFN